MCLLQRHTRCPEWVTLLTGELWLSVTSWWVVCLTSVAWLTVQYCYCNSCCVVTWCGMPFLVYDKGRWAEFDSATKWSECGVHSASLCRTTYFTWFLRSCASLGKEKSDDKMQVLSTAHLCRTVIRFDWATRVTCVTPTWYPVYTARAVLRA